MKLPVYLEMLKIFLRRENVALIEKFMRSANRAEISKLTGIKYRRTCHIFSFPNKMTDHEIELIAKAIGIDKQYVAKFIAKRN